MIAVLGILLISPLWITASECFLINNGPSSDGEKNTLKSYNQSEEKVFLGCKSTPLHFAVALLRSLLIEGADPWAVDCDGISPVDIATNSNIRHLLKDALPIKEENEKYTTKIGENCTNTPLHSVVRLIVTLSRQSSSFEMRDCHGLAPFDIINEGAFTGLDVEMVLLPPKSNSRSIKKVEDFCNRTSLHGAVIQNDFVNVLQLLEKKQDIYALDCNGMTPMDLAIVKNHTEIMLLLAQAQFDVSRKRHDGSSLMSLAISEGSFETVKTLLDLGVNLQDINKNMSSLFNKALMHNRLDIIKLFLSYGSNINYRTENGDSFLHILSEEGNTRGMYLSRKFGLITSENINLKNKKGETALSKAVKGNYPAIINILVSCGANITSNTEGGQTYLHIAVKNKSLDALQTLLDNGLPADIRDGNNYSAMYLAVELDLIAPMEILKSHGADVQQKYGSENLLHKAAFFNSPKSILWLLDNGLTVDERNVNNFTPLHIAAKYGHLEAAEVLLAGNANLLVKTNHGDTPLHWAAWQGSLPIVKKLLSKGMSVDVQQESDWTPLHVAASRNHLLVVKELLSQGASLNAVTNKQKTPLSIAGNDEIKKYLESKGGK